MFYKRDLSFGFWQRIIWIAVVGTTSLLEICAANETPEVVSGPLVRIASGVSGHIHPAACVTKRGTVIVIFGQSDYKDLMLARSMDGGKSWEQPVLFLPSAKEAIYPGSLTTLADGRILHFWNVWYPESKVTGGRSRFAQYSISQDEGVTWSEPRSLDKPVTPEIHSVIRHPIVELEADQWLIPLMDRTIVWHPSNGQSEPFGDGRKHGLVPIVRSPKQTLISGAGLRSTDLGRTWQQVAPFPKIGADGWRYDLMVTSNGWLIASEVVGPGVGGNLWRFVISYDDGISWDVDGAKVFYNPGRPIGGRACPKTVQVDAETIGTVLYDVDPKQPNGPGVFFSRTPLAKLARKSDTKSNSR